MGFLYNQVTVGTAPTLICQPLASGYVMVQNMAAGTCTIGGPGIQPGKGVSLPSFMTQPIQIPVAHYGGFMDADDGLYGAAATGTCTVAVIIPT